MSRKINPGGTRRTKYCGGFSPFESADKLTLQDTFFVQNHHKLHCRSLFLTESVSASLCRDTSIQRGGEVADFWIFFFFFKSSQCQFEQKLTNKGCKSKIIFLIASGKDSIPNFHLCCRNMAFFFTREIWHIHLFYHQTTVHTIRLRYRLVLAIDSDDHLNNH